MAADESSVATELRVKHVLVPLDGSEFALQALPTARVLATRFGADLQTVSVAGADYDAERFRLQATAALGVGSGDDRAFVATNGAPAEVIAGRSQELDSCLVCLTTHGRGRLHGAVIGSVLQRLAEPMVALGPSADNPGWSPRPRSWPVPLSVPRGRRVRRWVRDVRAGAAAGGGVGAGAAHVYDNPHGDRGCATAASMVHASVAPCLVAPVQR